MLQMHRRQGQQPQGFALFSSGPSARAAVELLSRMQFDDEIVLRCEVARKVSSAACCPLPCLP